MSEKTAEPSVLPATPEPPEAAEAGDAPILPVEAHIPPPVRPVVVAEPPPVVIAISPPNRSEQLALGVGALLATLAIMWVAEPVGIGILLGTLIAFTLQPVYRRLYALSKSPTIAALICVGVTLLTLGLSTVGFIYLLVDRGILRIRELVVALQPGGPVRHVLERAGKWISHLGIHPERFADQLGEATTAVSGRLAGAATVIAGATFSMLLSLFFLLLSTYFVLQNWSGLARRAEIMLPLRPRDTRALFDEFRRVGRTVLLGTVLTGLAQGVLATIGFLISGVPEAAVLGAVTTLASLVPGIGTLLVWVPAGIYLLLTGHVGMGILELVWGTVVVVGVSDYVIRPRLVSESGDVPAIMTFIALFGGLEVFGLVGLILGPVVISLSVALLRIYEREATLRRSPEVSPPPPSIPSV